ncbi:TonB-dependent receptor [Rhodohalobacter sp. 614A]|uniref:TonB-dependent receptor n=1 Tax=Rhodohalobacter sp. 614A TaxID=2908649 RepID=UPI001F2A4BD3|nr:TonB-dependent receptor [Rhodohalobacter sp. 614A]
MKFSTVLFAAVIACFFSTEILFAQTGSISGMITDESGESLPGITIQFKDSPKGVATDATGFFIIENIPAGRHTFVVSGVGFSRQEFEAEIRANEKTDVEITLNRSTTELETLTVEAKSETQEIREQAYSVTSIGTRSIENRSTNMNQVLTRAAGIRVREQGGMGSNFNVSINGLSGRAVRFFVDGKPIDRFGSAYGINNFPINLVDRIEVYKGVVPAEFGSDALGGVVNLVTKSGYNNFVDVSYSIGSFGTHQTSFLSNWQHPSNGLSLNLEGFFNYSDNNYEVWGEGVEVGDPETGRAIGIRIERFHDAYRSWSGKAEIGLNDKKWADTFTASFIYADDKNEVQHGATMASVYGEAERMEETIGPSAYYLKDDLFVDGLGVELYSSFTWLESTTVDTSSRRYNWAGEVIDERPTNSEMGSGRNGKSLLTLSNENQLYQGSAWYEMNDNHQLRFNVTIDHTERDGNDPYISNRTASFREPQEIKKRVVSLSYQADALDDKLNQTVWAKNYDFKAYSVDEEYVTDSLGHRPVAFPVEGSTNDFGYGYAVKYSFSDDLIAKFSAEKTYRIPDADEILGDGLFVANSPNLEPESSLNFNLSFLANRLKIGQSRISFEPSFFYRNTENLILYIVQENRNSGSYSNIGKVRGMGASLDATYEYQHWLNLNANITYQDLRDWRETIGPNRNQTYKDRLRNTPYLMSNGELNLRKTEFFREDDEASFFWSVKYVHEFFLNWPSLGNPNTKSAIPAQLVNDIGVNYSFSHGTYNVSFEVRNLLNEQVYDNYLLQKPGRGFYLKLRTFFNQK